MNPDTRTGVRTGVRTDDRIDDRTGKRAGIRTAALAAALAATAPAWAVTFSSTSYTTSASASAQGQSDSSSQGGDAAALPLFSTATAAGLDDFATSAAAAGEGLLSVATTVDSLAGAASAGAEARFVGSFSDSGRLRFSFDFSTFDLPGGGTAGSTLSVLLTTTSGNATSTLLSSSFSAAGNHVFEYQLAAGSTTALDLRLVGNAATTGMGQAADHLAQAGFAVTAVPEPGTWLLLAFGLGGIGLARRGRVAAAA